MIRDLNLTESKAILADNYIGNLSYIYNNKPYVVPITYFFDADKNAFIMYSSVGHKTEALEKNNAVSIGVTEIENINNWKSVLAEGSFEKLSSIDSKAYLREFALGIKELISRKEDKKPLFISEFSSKMYYDKVPIVFKIVVDSITGKYRTE
ncbi:pyridoxamine 5'-phosphate oxidase family protein [Tenacibaculum sp. MEBiC06402]|uniref:pyridoxamine 5'-phosphate oxidase family protein n=1 Tax=unclassified Tenacibaculum TaxID=2635139 RepID=UPI003B9D2F27